MKHILHHLLFPRESNNHRAKLLHHDSLFFIIALFVFFGSLLTSIHTNYPQVLGISTNISSDDLLTFTNQKRHEHGLSPLVMNGQLTQAAQQKATHMFTNNYWAHIAPDGTTPWFFIKNAGYEYLYAGENLARGFTTASDVVDAWMNSPSHRENMLSKNYNDVGFSIQTGTLTGTETILVVEELGSKYFGQKDDKETVPTVPVVQVTLSPTQAVLPSLTPTPILSKPTTIPSSVQEQSTTGVASVQNQPLFDKSSLTKNISFALLILFLLVLIVDAMIIERKKIARVVAHNVDHIIFIVIIILVVIIIERGLIL